MSLQTGSDVVKKNEWNHVVMTYDNTASQINVYVDGNLVGQKDVQVSTNVVGGFKDITFGEGVDGLVDDIEIYGRALNREDAVRLATEGRYAKSSENTYHNVRITDFKHSPGIVDDQRTDRQYQVSNGSYATGVVPGTRSLSFEGSGHISLGTDEIIGDDSDAFTVSAWIKLNNGTTSGQKILHKTGVIDFYVENDVLNLKLGDQTTPISFTPVASPGVPEIDDNVFPDGLSKGETHSSMPINAGKITLSGFMKKGAGFDSVTKFHSLFSLGANDELNLGVVRDASAAQDKFELRAKRPSLIASSYTGLWNTEFNLAMENSTVDVGGGTFTSQSGADASFTLTLKDVKRRATLQSVSFKCPNRSNTPSRVRISSKEDGGSYGTILDMPIAFVSSSNVYKFVMGAQLNAGVSSSTLANPKSDVVRVEFLRDGAKPIKVTDVNFSSIIEETITPTATVTDGYQTVRISGNVSGTGGGGTLKVFKTSEDRDANTNPFMTLTPDANGYFEGTEYDGRAAGDATAPNGRDGTYSYFFAKTTPDRARRVFADSVSAYLKEQYSITGTTVEVLQESTITGGTRFNKIRFSGVTNTSGVIRIYISPFNSSYTEVACTRDVRWTVDRTTETAQGTYTYRHWLQASPPGQPVRYPNAATENALGLNELGQSPHGFQVYIYDFTFNLSTSQIYVRKGSNNFARPTYTGANYNTPTHNESSFNKDQAHTQTITYTAGNSLGSGSISRDLSVVVYNTSFSVANHSAQTVKVGSNHHSLNSGDFHLDNMEYYYVNNSQYPGTNSGGNDQTYSIDHYFRDTRDHSYTASVATTVRKYTFSRASFKNISINAGQWHGWGHMVSSWGTNSHISHAEENWHGTRDVHAWQDGLSQSAGNHSIRFHTYNSVTGGEGAWTSATMYVAATSRYFTLRLRSGLRYNYAFTWRKTHYHSVKDAAGRVINWSYWYDATAHRTFQFGLHAMNGQIQLSWNSMSPYHSLAYGSISGGARVGRGYRNIPGGHGSSSTSDWLNIYTWAGDD